MYKQNRRTIANNPEELRIIFEKHTKEVNGCIVPNIAPASNGYTNILYKGKWIGSHCLAAMLYLDYDLNSDKQVNHSCGNRACIKHIYIGNQSRNMRDAVEDKTHAQSRKTHCPHGHEYTPENTLVFRRNGQLGRKCRACQKESNARRYIR